MKTRQKLKIITLCCLLMPIMIPAIYINDGMGKYDYGFPFHFITIYQSEPTSIWFFSNFFSGNSGLYVNPLTLFLNVVIISFILTFLLQKRNIVK